MNTLTGLIPDIYAALHVVSREIVGFLPAISLNPGVERAAVGQTVKIPYAPPSTAEDISPATNPPDTGDQVMGSVPFTITKARAVPFRWTGEEVKGLNHGPGVLTLKQQQIAQAFRTLINEMESDIAANYYLASRAYGTAGTAPFSSTIEDLAQVRKILVDNGCPQNDLHLVMDTMAGVKMRSLTNLYKVNEAGSDSLLRQGVLTSLYGVDLRESAQVKLHTKGAGTAYQLNGVHALNAETLALDTGSGTLLKGDILTIGNGTPADSNKYVANSDITGGAVTLAGPGLLSSHVDNDLVTIGNSYRANMLFHRSAIIGAIRPPALPEEGDSAADRMLITDPHTGITFEIAMYLQYRRVRYEISAAWGFKTINPRHVALLLG